MPDPYTPREYAEMHYIYGMCGGNARLASREYRNRYPNRERYPDHRVFIRVHNSYLEGEMPGAVQRTGRPRGDDEEVLALVEEDPFTSIRRVSRATGVSIATVHRILRRNNQHPYHVQRVQALLPRDYAPRVAFCREMLRRCRQDPNFFDCILWSDESSFRRLGVFNMHNLHFWAVENPRIRREDRFQYQFGINLWAGILGGRLIGPFELPARLNGDRYLEFLQQHLYDLLEDVPLDLRARMWLQHDGAPAHSAQIVRDYLNAAYPGRWIGRGGVPWPPRSPDLNPLDYFLWGYFKELVYQTENNNENQLRQNIQDAATNLRNNARAFRNLRRNFIRRCRLCITAGGRHFEHLL